MTKHLLRLIVVVVVLIPPDTFPGWNKTRESLLRPVTLTTARSTLAGIHLLGIEASRDGSVIRHAAGFAYEITYRCTGFVLMSLLTIAMLSARVSSRRKLAGLALGLPCVCILNWIRLLSLFWIGINNPRLFGLAHDVIWEGVMILVTAGIWLWWRRTDAEPIGRDENSQWNERSVGMSGA